MPELHAHFEIGEDADSMYPMIPLDGTDPETAMAMVNPEMMVEVNMLSIVDGRLRRGRRPHRAVPGREHAVRAR